MASNAAQVQGPPYPPTTAGPGGVPSIIPNVPILAILLCLYIGAAVGHMATLQINLRRHRHKFLISGALFGFCISRITTCSLRISSAVQPDNVSLSIAANIFVNAGILILYIVNLIFLQRIVRARRPEVGWHRIPRILCKVFYGLVALALVLLITFIVLSFYTLDAGFKRVARDIQIACLTYFLIIAALPLFVLALIFVIPESPRAETFGQGSMRTKALILAFATTLCTLNAGFKAGITWAPPRPLSDPAWYQKKAAFYVFYFGLEIIIVYLFLAARVDRRFHVPDGSSTNITYAAQSLESMESRPDTGTTQEEGRAPEMQQSGPAQNY
ncbi:Hypothetical predicted protein [Lecanosticta acicola]|uniref:Uncharacterized protein n=1 Tax=Lecanosticta acicola TaxID=111012 RepID=A0AAI9E6J3_9PEZI|nr:Hypothetical predicted protein [Lecanosticta acicola]